MRVLTHFLLWKVGLAAATTQTTLAERQCLSRRAAGKKTLVEIGVWHGVTTATLRRAMSPEGTVFGVDPFERGRLGVSFQHLIAEHEIGKVASGRYVLIRKTSREAAREWTTPIDFIFIDGDHSYEGLRLDWEAWSPHLVAGGVVALHDSRSSAARDLTEAGSARYTKDAIVTDPRFAVVDEVDSLTVLERRGSSIARGGT